MEGRPKRANPINSQKLCRPYVLIAIQHPSAKDGRGIHSQPTLFELQPSHAAPICTLPPPALLRASPRWDYSALSRAARASSVGAGVPSSLSRKVCQAHDLFLLHRAAHSPKRSTTKECGVKPLWPIRRTYRSLHVHIQNSEMVEGPFVWAGCSWLWLAVGAV